MRQQCEPRLDKNEYTPGSWRRFFASQLRIASKIENNVFCRYSVEVYLTGGLPNFRQSVPSCFKVANSPYLCVFGGFPNFGPPLGPSTWGALYLRSSTFLISFKGWLPCTYLALHRMVRRTPAILAYKKGKKSGLFCKTGGNLVLWRPGEILFLFLSFLVW